MLNQIVAGGAGSTEAVVARAEVLLLIGVDLLLFLGRPIGVTVSVRISGTCICNRSLKSCALLQRLYLTQELAYLMCAQTC